MTKKTFMGKPLPTSTVVKHTQSEYAGIVADCFEKYDYQKAIERAHYQGKPVDYYAEQFTSKISLDEMTERYGSADFLLEDMKHFESEVIRRVDEEAEQKREAKKVSYEAARAKAEKEMALANVRLEPLGRKRLRKHMNRQFV